MIETSLPDVPTSPYDELLGGRLTEASGDRVVMELDIGAQLHQPYGLVHGGVYASMAETTASVGAALAVGERGGAVGVSNHTDFLHAVRDGSLRAEATPLSRSRSLQLWQVAVTDASGRLVAHAKVKLYNLPTPQDA